MSTSKKKNPKRTRRTDGVLTPEELTNAIEAYKAKRAARLAAKTDADTPTTEVVESEKPETAAPVVAPAEDATVEEKVEMVKDRRDRRDEEGDPKTVEEAQGVIANQDEDIGVLFDIIDTLLAEKAFDESEEPGAESEGKETAVDEGEEEPISEETAADEDEEITGTDSDDEEAVEGEEVITDEDDDEEISTHAPAENGKVNADSIDKIVRQRIKIGMIGRTMNIDGLEDMPPEKAKKVVIKAVRPNVRLDGKSSAYIQALFDLACDEVKAKSKKGVEYQKKQMFNSDGYSAKKASGGSANAARQRMIERQHNRNKEDK